MFDTVTKQHVTQVVEHKCDPAIWETVEERKLYAKDYVGGGMYHNAYEVGKVIEQRCTKCGLRHFTKYTA